MSLGDALILVWLVFTWFYEGHHRRKPTMAHGDLPVIHDWSGRACVFNNGCTITLSNNMPRALIAALVWGCYTKDVGIA